VTAHGIPVPYGKDANRATSACSRSRLRNTGFRSLISMCVGTARRQSLVRTADPTVAFRSLIPMYIGTARKDGRPFPRASHVS